MQVLLSKSRCAASACTLKPAYGHAGKKPVYCEKHRAAGMVRRILLAPFVCDESLLRVKVVFFGAHWMSRPQADWPCLLLLMQVNLIAGRCEHEGCNIIAWYGYQGQNRRFCSRHKLPGMVGSQRARSCASSERMQRHLLSAGISAAQVRGRGVSSPGATWCDSPRRWREAEPGA